MPRSRSRSRGNKGRSRSPARKPSRSPPRKSSRSRSPRRRRASRSRSRGKRSTSRPKGESEEVKLEGEAVAYVLGRDGTTKRRLEKCSGCEMEVGSDTITVYGSPEERKLGIFFIEVTLQQRNRKMVLDFEELARRDNCETLDVPSECVGFVLGNRGATLRSFEDQSAAYMVFDNDRTRDGKKRLYILGHRKGRERAKCLVEEAVSFRLKKDQNGGPGRGGKRSRSRSRERERRRRSSSRDRRRRSRSR